MGADLHALIAMLDYMLIEVAALDPTSVWCLAMARQCLRDRLAAYERRSGRSGSSFVM
jgi:hypothetical protein